MKGLREKHIEAVHGRMKIFCYYFNNDYDCPYDDQCIFAHDASPVCKFGRECERIMCMFKHDGRDVSDDENEDDEESEDESDEENKDEKRSGKDLIKITELEPSLKKVEEAMDKVNVLLQKTTSPLKCDLCEFEARNANGLTMHKKSKHTDKSK